MKKKNMILLLLCCTFLLHGDEKKCSWTLEITPGSSYSFIKWYGPLPMKKKPLIAVWLEDSQGRVLKTLYVTDRAAENRWRGGAEERPESLPVYYGRRDASASLREDVDVISAASKGAAPEARQFQDAFPIETARVMAEVNISYDYNDFYTVKTSGVNGQPSLVYKAEWDGQTPSCILEPAGTGSLDGTDGDIHGDLDRLTSARHLLENISLTCTGVH